MYTRSGINDLLTELAAELPALLRDRATFFHASRLRSQQILAAAAPADKAVVLEVLQAFAQRCGVDADYNDRHAA